MAPHAGLHCGAGDRAFLACLLLQWTIGGIIHGATMPAPRVPDWVAVAIEGVLTLGLVSVILGTSSGARNIGTNAAIAVGGYIGIVAVWAAPVTYWIYLVGPMIGASSAVGFEYILKGRATGAGAEAAQGTFEADDTADL